MQTFQIVTKVKKKKATLKVIMHPSKIHYRLMQTVSMGKSSNVNKRMLPHANLMQTSYKPHADLMQTDTLK